MGKIYTSKEEYFKDLKYWSNCTGDLFNPYGNPAEGEDAEWIELENLPRELSRAYEELWSEGTGSYCYLCEYKGAYGIALVNEYHELTDEGNAGERNNFTRAVSVMKGIEDLAFRHECISDVFIGKQIGFEDNPGDPATELVVFLAADTSCGEFKDIAEYLYEHVYI